MCQSSKIDEKDVELLRNGSVHKLYHLKALITVEKVTTSVAEKKKNLSDQNYDGEGNWSGVVNFHCMQIESCGNLRFTFGDDWNNVPSSSRFSSLAMM